jgi:hypothetical protein
MYKYFVAYKKGTLTGNGVIESDVEIKTNDHILKLQDYIDEKVPGEKAIIINYILIKD